MTTSQSIKKPSKVARSSKQSKISSLKQNHGKYRASFVQPALTKKEPWWVY